MPDAEPGAQASAGGKRSGTASVSSSRSTRSSRHSGELAAYYDFSRGRSGSLVVDEPVGLSGFLEYRKLDGSWRPFLFQTVDFQLVLYRVHATHQVTVMSTDIRSATEIALAYEGSKPKETRLLRLGINGTVITLRAISHNAAVHWVEGLQRLKAGKSLTIKGDRVTLEAEDDIFEQIDKMTLEREWAAIPPPPPTVGLCGLCLPRFSAPKKLIPKVWS